MKDWIDMKLMRPFGNVWKKAFSLVLPLGALLAAGCADHNDDGKLLRLGYFPNVTHAQGIIGVQRGDFQKALGDGVKLESSTYNAGPSVIEAVFAGHLDIAYVGPSPALNGFLKSKGEEVRIIAGSGTNGVLVVGSKERNITTLEQLRGKQIASPQLGNTQDISARFFVVDHLKTKLKDQGGDTEVIPVANPDIETLFAKNQLDAAWVPEPWGSRLISKGLAVLVDEEKNLWAEKSFALTNVIARKDFLEKHPDLVKKFLSAHVKITKELQADPQSFAALINAELKRLTSKDLPADVLAGSLKYTGFSTDPGAASIARFFEMGKAVGAIKDETLDIDKLMAPQLLREVEAGDDSATTGSDSGT